MWKPALMKKVNVQIKRYFAKTSFESNIVIKKKKDERIAA